jgi:hypothetical protein
MHVGISPQINHMKLDKHTRRLLLSPSVRIARSKLFLLIASISRCYNLLTRYVYIYTQNVDRPKPRAHTRTYIDSGLTYGADTN